MPNSSDYTIIHFIQSQQYFFQAFHARFPRDFDAFWPAIKKYTWRKIIFHFLYNTNIYPCKKKYFLIEVNAKLLW